jgi:adenosine kinase
MNNKFKKIKQVKYLTFGSPLIDIIVNVNEEFINKFNIELSTTLHVNSKENDVFENVLKFFPKYLPGGCSYNTIRVMNWMMNCQEDLGSFACLGSVGEDSFADTYKTLLNKEFIQSIFEVIPTGVTGKCAVICYKKERTHLTDLGVSCFITEDFVELNWNVISQAKLIFTELFILPSCKRIILKLADLCLNNEKLFSFNFPSIFFLGKYSIDIIDVISYGDIIFANKDEAIFFVTKILNKKCNDDSELALILSMLPKINKIKDRIFIVTCGAEPAQICVYNHKNEKIVFKGSFPPIKIENDKIIDTNGAGDFFAGGFLAYYEKGYDFESCIKAGHWAASKIIQTKGCDKLFHEKPNPILG